MRNVLGSQEPWNLKTLIVDQKRLRIPYMNLPLHLRLIQPCAFDRIYQCVCVRLGPHLFAAYLMSTSSTRGLPDQSKTQHGVRATKNEEEHSEDQDASLLSLSASDNPTAISACLCPQRMLCPLPPTNQQATQPVTSQCSQISCDPIRACCRALLRLRVKERQTERE